MNIFQKLTLFAKLSGQADQLERALQMKKSTQIVAAIFALLTTVAQVPAVNQSVGGFLSAHPSISTIAAGVIGLLSLFHQPASTDAQ